MVALLLLIAPTLGFGEENAAQDYTRDEFPKVLQDLRRGEIILAGSFPFTLFITLEAFDIYRYASNGGAQEYAPWPFRSTSSAPYEGYERTIILVSAVSLSALIALADYVVGKIVERRAKDPPSSGR
jgi:hypothetical protein